MRYGTCNNKCGDPGNDEHLENLTRYMSDDRKLMIGGNAIDYNLQHDTRIAEYSVDFYEVEQPYK